MSYRGLAVSYRGLAVSFGRTTSVLVVAGLALGLVAGVALAQDRPMAVYSPAPVFDALSPNEWRRVDQSVDRGLAWLATQQQADGSIPTYIGGQPAVTALAAMAFLSRGHHPGAGPYGETLNRAIDYCLECQRENGLFLLDSPNQRADNWNRGGHTGLYNHAITGLMLGEVYGATNGERGKRIKPAIDRALEFARRMQLRPGKKPLDSHGWRYLQLLNYADKGEADLSVTGWYVMFYRSAENAEFEAPQQWVDDAIEYVKVCYEPDTGAFHYGPYPQDRTPGRGMTGAGLLCLTVAGHRDEQVARGAGGFILRFPFDQYNQRVGAHDRYHYGAYYCSQAMFLLGGDYWRRFYPTLSRTLIENQTPSGAWPPDAYDGIFGQGYSTSLAILSLTPPYQLLPIYQR